jgi:hypothetical protein
VSEKRIRVRLLFADSGAFHHEDLELPASVFHEYDRLIDCLQEDAGILEGLYLDLGRLCAAWVLPEED